MGWGQKKTISKNKRKAICRDLRRVTKFLAPVGVSKIVYPKTQKERKQRKNPSDEESQARKNTKETVGGGFVWRGVKARKADRAFW